MTSSSAAWSTCLSRLSACDMAASARLIASLIPALASASSPSSSCLLPCLGCSRRCARSVIPLAARCSLLMTGLLARVLSLAACVKKQACRTWLQNAVVQSKAAGCCCAKHCYRMLYCKTRLQKCCYEEQGYRLLVCKTRLHKCSFEKQGYKRLLCKTRLQNAVMLDEQHISKWWLKSMQLCAGSQGHTGSAHMHWLASNLFACMSHVMQPKNGHKAWMPFQGSCSESQRPLRH